MHNAIPHNVLLPAVPTAKEPFHHLRQRHIPRQNRNQPREVGERQRLQLQIPRQRRERQRDTDNHHHQRHDNQRPGGAALDERNTARADHMHNQRLRQ